MSPLNLSSAEELPSLLMENELLRHEVTHLRARLASSEKAARASNGRVRHLQRVAAGAKGIKPADPVRAVDRSRNDIVWLLRRMDSSPAGWLFRRFRGFVELKSRYLGTAK